MGDPDRGPYLTDGLLSVSGANGRYLVGARTGNPVLLVGFHTWASVQDSAEGDDTPAAFDWDTFLEKLMYYGCNFTKLWTHETPRGWADGSNYWHAPTRYARTGPGNAADGGLKFDLTQINSDWLDRLYDRALACQDAGIYACIQLFQGWQIENKGWAGAPWTYHPYDAANNINSVDGDQNDDGQGTETHVTGATNTVLAYQEALVEAVIDRLNGLDNVIWEISNEDTGSVGNTAWQDYMIGHIKTYEATKTKQHPVMMSWQYPSGSNDNLDGSGADMVSYGANDTGPLTDPPTPTTCNMFDTDHNGGQTALYKWIWMALCRGNGGLWYMDDWDGVAYGSDTRNNATYILIRANLGYALAFAKAMPLLDMTPQAALSSSGYCLAKDHATAAHYLCFYDGSSTFTLDLTTAEGALNVTWLRCSTGETDTGTVSGGAERTLTPPWTGAVVAYARHG